MDTIGTGIVGAGFAADLHARVYRELTGLGIELVGVTSRTQARAEAFAQRHGVRQVLGDYPSLLELEDVDIIDLCIPNHVHKEFTLQAAQAGKLIICEKPLTGYFGEGRRWWAGPPGRGC